MATWKPGPNATAYLDAWQQRIDEDEPRLARSRARRGEPLPTPEDRAELRAWFVAYPLRAMAREGLFGDDEKGGA